MNRIGMLSVFASLLVAAFCVNCYAADASTEIPALEQRAQRVNAQIEELKSQNAARLNQQVAAYKQQIQAYVKQRVEIDSQVTKLEAMVDQLHKENESSFGRQMKVYTDMMQEVKSQLSSALSKKGAAAAQTAATADPKQKKDNVSARITAP